ncbi:hypothetical protein HPB47_001678 [Ixodes persulcatus]|uniref:Uncharacterized protein n=1 Tax=Ixodes persulcatus TaxID=34615 RepID=A0AC60PNC6_IXOPE|nr:hypothetical protein HPB47_001678 [Ixodes persulcatus]
MGCGEEGRQVDERIPGLVFADDVVLMERSLEELRKLLDTCGEEETTLGLMFNPNKSGDLGTKMEQRDTQRTEDAPTQLSQGVNIQGQEIEWKTEYKCLLVALREICRQLEGQLAAVQERKWSVEDTLPEVEV